ncbi:MAG: phosphoribosyltransferase [Planctomycetes bacterium]|nr:phosphoribosyltransferase [Planctomycetota bacterium]
MIFENRSDAAMKLAQKMKNQSFLDPIVLGIPRGGVVTAAVLAKELNADFDVVLSRKIAAPNQQEFAWGAISEDGQVFLNPALSESQLDFKEYLENEKKKQLTEIERRKKLIRSILPQSAVAGRSVIVTDDGIATGSTMIAALQCLRPRNPFKLIVATPVASPSRLADVRHWCDEVICFHSNEYLMSIGEFYIDFSPVEESLMLDIIREMASIKTHSK